MIALWLVYALLMSFWLGLTALLLERGVRMLRRSTRYVWAGALVLSVVLPVASALRAIMAPAAEGEAGAGASVMPGVWPPLLDRGLLIGWLAGSLVLAASIALAQRALLRARRQWPARDVLGTRVLVSRDFGPGVIALGRAQIVLPDWALQMESALQELMVEHEAEHLRARDHTLILLGLTLLVLCPFNAVLWWQFRRLKLAIEMDCDARVLAGRRDVRRYAALLLDVGERSRTSRLVFAAFAAPPHAIERRIRVMLDRKPRSRLLTAGLAGAGAFVIAVLACQTPEPLSPEEPLRQALGLVPEPPPPPPHASEGRKYDAIKEMAEPVVTYHVVEDGLKPPPPPPPPPGAADWKVQGEIEILKTLPPPRPGRRKEELDAVLLQKMKGPLGPEQEYVVVMERVPLKRKEESSKILLDASLRLRTLGK